MNAWYGLQQGVISECGQGLSTDSQCMDQELATYIIYNLKKITIKIGYTLLSL